jgi:sterol desaturase/sphingolipid hydroxylase (fatty acid hydroxylase superfamily)
MVVGAFGLLAWAEMRRPLRQHRETKVRRDIRNLAVAALSAVTLQAFEKPVVDPLSKLVERHRWGCSSGPACQFGPKIFLPWPDDYTLYLWHVLVDRVPFLWRFHQVHHADLDMDASTAPRFHFGEMAVSVP